MKKNYEFLGKIIGAALFLIIVSTIAIYTSYSGRFTDILSKNTIPFQTCNTEVFSRDKNISTMLDGKINENDLKVLELKCIEKYPNKRDVTIVNTKEEHQFTISEENTVTIDIDIPQNTLLKKSTMDIEFKVTKANVTEGMTFFGYSIGKIQLRDATTRLGATHQNILKKSYTLDEIYYQGDNTQLIMTNMLGNDIEVNYIIDYYIENY